MVLPHKTQIDSLILIIFNNLHNSAHYIIVNMKFNFFKGPFMKELPINVEILYNHKDFSCMYWTVYQLTKRKA